jgi:hypothetical protein
MEAMRFSETSISSKSTRRHILEYDILHSHRHENLKSYTYSIVACLFVGEETFLQRRFLAATPSTCSTTMVFNRHVKIPTGWLCEFLGWELGVLQPLRNSSTELISENTKQIQKAY